MRAEGQRWVQVAFLDSNQQWFTGNMTFKQKVERGERVRSANISKKTLQADGVANEKILRCKYDCSIWKTQNKTKQKHGGSVAGADKGRKRDGDEVREETDEISWGS